MVRSEQAIKHTFLHGAWGNESNFANLKVSFGELHKTFDHTWIVFKELYPFFCECLYGGNFPIAFGTEDHMKEIWDSLPASALLKKLGTVAVNNRWWAWNQKLRKNLSGDALMLMVLMYQCLVKGEVESIAEIENFGGVHGVWAVLKQAANPAIEAASTSSSSASAVEAKSVKESDHVQRAMHNKQGIGRNMTLVVCANFTSRKLAIGRMRISEPLEVEHGKTITTLNTQMGSLRWYVGKACRDYDDTLCKIWAVLEDDAFLNEVCFTGTSHDLGHNSTQECQMLADVFFTFARSLVAAETESPCTRIAPHWPF
jgi:hypothetical protein